ncbi:MAG: hypothetical protein A2Y10_18760 [Planctomycetes bacterium GWF2_41_51]|nr:MAG: hypothetical protein A2Y10_18760 [Planctomycetes bacterium GWF2_41_51]HBG27110.1 hypothetical protein [Phycisphaerales bacterium]
MKLSTSYIPPHQPVHLSRDLEDIKSIGCTDVLFALQENHFQWLNGSIRFGPKIASQIGLRSSAVIWGFANTSGGGRSSRVMLENPEMWRVDENSKAYGGGYPNPMACYNNPLTVVKYGEYIKLCSDNGIAGILIDEPAVQECFCENCKNKFARLYGGDLVKSKKNVDYLSFQAQTTIDFVSNSAAIIKNINKNIEVSVCVMPPDIENFKEIAKLNNIDSFSTDPYWLMPNSELNIKKAIDVSIYCKKLAIKHNKVFSLYLGCFGIASGLEGKIYTEGKVLINSTMPDILTTWSYRGGIGLSSLSSEECDDPDVAWQNVVKLYKDYSTV